FNDKQSKGQPQGIAPTGASLGNIIGAFKSITTNAYTTGVKTQQWPTFNGKLWQRNYYEHIIRTHDDYLRISNYINNNPKNWVTDRLR
ncbi:transposase, partial [Arthrospira platensis SPKY1]|nr:transposase [Arthrospira platensis SPKY1]